ncbi:N-acetylglucosaminyl-phosphatidylinositol de-N-acetylase [Cordyceps fumosorosea ARSEF 2679]|uniref:N-acetylglucosaminylphosphatidylinositol deacetylase n=1 Tax=Cordyceps fumosorosea (strain ARSEF 2679) TaxID=1081104 RepID=A0A167PQG9_CORFA|nr:N-acetylglucosaminyl-phosphatidylinositol de-N-acetylase [Cordyceps fumosorosea ARSEF 2679]OAA56921.1 N-acetylglucosaminyl-phosphatidylinositol de-N-acetylase [Cordyceps fumosorosea ARSEF 2679]
MKLLLLLLVIAIVLLLGVCYGRLTAAVQRRLPKLQNKRICLLIAHPDDESMFFAPTLLALTRPETGNHVKVLCLSTGNNQGLGQIRKKELFKSCSMLGLKQDDVFVIDSIKFRDSQECTWDKDDISNLLYEPFIRETADGPPSSPKSKKTIVPILDVLITFDQHGVSSHPNHISLYNGARAFVSSLRQRQTGSEQPGVDLYTLTTVPLLRKFTSFMDGFVTWLIWSGDAERQGGGGKARRLLFFNSLTGEGGVPTAWRTMTTAHKSQMVWFRWAWVAFSRYMVVNDLKLEQT